MNALTSIESEINLDDNAGKYFIAIDIPEEIKNDLYSKVKDILNNKKELNVVSKRKYHITVFYIGFSEKDRALNFFSKIPELSAFKIGLKGIGYFNSRVIWLGIDDIEGKLSDLHDLYLYDDFKPHLTLARNKIMQKKQFQKLIEMLRETNPHYEFIAKEVTLFESIQTNEGHIYKRIASKTFG